LATQENKKGSCIGGASWWACQKTRSCTRGMYQKSNFPLPKKKRSDRSCTSDRKSFNSTCSPGHIGLAGTKSGTEVEPTHSPFLSVLYWLRSQKGNVPHNLNNQTTQSSGNIFSSLTRKDSISVAIDKNSFLSCPVDPIDISIPPRFQVLKDIFGSTGGPYPEILSFPKCFPH